LLNTFYPVLNRNYGTFSFKIITELVLVDVICYTDVQLLNYLFNFFIVYDYRKSYIALFGLIVVFANKIWARLNFGISSVIKKCAF
jgi:hypothetical protein